MPNNWFQFKQFLIEQEGSAMKVSTDSVILGAWVDVQITRRVLDVGTGSGLLSLMMAQRIPDCLVDAVEIDDSAYRQALKNVHNSPWKERIELIKSSFQDFLTKNTHKYDLIICNPPYFKNSMKSPGKSRAIARHADSLPWTDLINGSLSILNKEGRLAVIIPADGYDEFTKIAKKAGLHPLRLLKIFPNPAINFKRTAVEYSLSEAELKEEELTIEKGGRHDYTEGYKSLTAEFYL
jgi:tRNA1Val (adenine37-N6)-methyltransferase